MKVMWRMIRGGTLGIDIIPGSESNGTSNWNTNLLLDACGSTGSLIGVTKGSPSSGFSIITMMANCSRLTTSSFVTSASSMSRSSVLGSLMLTSGSAIKKT